MLRSPELRVARKEVQQATSGSLSQRLWTFVLAVAVSAAAHDLLGEDIVPAKQNNSPTPTEPKELHPADVNDHIHRIPLDLPHVVDRQEIITKGARRCIVILLQYHMADGLTKEDAANVEASQAEIYELSQALLKGGWIDSIHNEGRMAAGEPEPDPATYRPVVQLSQPVRMSNLARFGAIETLAEEGKIVIKGAERTAAYNASGPAVNMPDGEERTKLLLDDREDGFLSVIDGEGDDASCTVWGFEHDFINNLDCVNLDALINNKPEKLTSAVILTTKTIQKILRQQRIATLVAEGKIVPPAVRLVPPPPKPDPDLFKEVPASPASKPGNVGFSLGTPKKKPVRTFIDIP